MSSITPCWNCVRAEETIRALLAAAEHSLTVAESCILSEYEGTVLLPERLAELDPTRAAIRAAREYLA